MKTVGIIGSGRLGSSLACVLHKSVESRLVWIVARSNSSQIRLLQTLEFAENKPEFFSSIPETQTLPDILINTVPDAEIESVCHELVSHFGEKLSGCSVVHCSGALSRAHLRLCQEVGAATWCAHPFQTFGYCDVNAFENVAWGIEAPKEYQVQAENFVVECGGKPFHIDGEKKTLYHASAVFASNYMFALAETARVVAQEAGIPPDEFLPAIMKQTFEKILTSLQTSSTMAFTGPVVRGDIFTIQQHLRQLQDYALFAEVYRTMAHATADFCRSNGSLSDEKFQSILKSLRPIV